MILILNTEAGDFSHPKFIDWLEYYNADYEILTGESIFKGNTSLYIKDNELYVNERNYTADVKVVFNRRWLTVTDLPLITDDLLLNKGINRSLSSELYEIRNFLNYNLRNAFWIPNINKLNVNKITILQKSQEIGLKVPKYVITNKKNELIKFHDTHKTIISKAIGNFTKTETKDNITINSIYTKVVSKELINSLPDYFFVSMFQEYIPKAREYRVLYFNEKCYTTEILSQENKYSIIDSRVTDKNDNKTRLQRFELPKIYQGKINEFMKSIKLNIGCLDVLESKDGELYFLEVNPVGQISGYSDGGNLNFEKDIVEQMIIIDGGN